MSDQVQDLTQGSGSQFMCKGKVCSRGHWADGAETWQVFYPHVDMDIEMFWTHLTPTPWAEVAKEWFWRSVQP